MVIKRILWSAVNLLYQNSNKMPHINLLIFFYTSLKNSTIANAMLRFFALSKQKLIINIQYGIL